MNRPTDCFLIRLPELPEAFGSQRRTYAVYLTKKAYTFATLKRIDDWDLSDAIEIKGDNRYKRNCLQNTMSGIGVQVMLLMPLLVSWIFFGRQLASGHRFYSQNVNFTRICE